MKTATLRISDIKEGYTPRKDFGDEEELLRDIQKHGLEFPIGVRLDGGKPVTYEGNRRLRVLKKLGHEEAPCVVAEEMDERTAAYRSYVLNTDMGRKNLNPIEKANHLKWLQDNFNYTVKELVAEGYANDDQTIYNILSLLTLPEVVQQEVAKGVISLTVAYELAKKCKTEAQKKKMAKNIDKIKDLSVRKAKKAISQIDLEEKPSEKEDPTAQPADGEIVGVSFKEPEDMSEFKDESLALILVSTAQRAGEETAEKDTGEEQIQQVCEDLPVWRKKLTPGGFLCIRFSDTRISEAGNTEPEIRLQGHRFQEALRPVNTRLRDIIVLDKGGKVGSKVQDLFKDGMKHTAYHHTTDLEYIYIFKRDGDRGIPDDLEMKARISQEEWKAWGPAVWKITSTKANEGQNDTLIEEVSQRLIKMYSYPGDIVVDTAAGTGATLDVAKNLGRRAYGYEKDPKYMDAILKRTGFITKDPPVPKDMVEATESDGEFSIAKEVALAKEMDKRITFIKKDIEKATIADAPIPPPEEKGDDIEVIFEPQAEAIDLLELSFDTTHSTKPEQIEPALEQGVI